MIWSDQEDHILRLMREQGYRVPQILPFLDNKSEGQIRVRIRELKLPRQSCSPTKI